MKTIVSKETITYFSKALLGFRKWAKISDSLFKMSQTKHTLNLSFTYTKAISLSRICDSCVKVIVEVGIFMFL